MCFSPTFAHTSHAHTSCVFSEAPAISGGGASSSSSGGGSSGGGSGGSSKKPRLEQPPGELVSGLCNDLFVHCDDPPIIEVDKMCSASTKHSCVCSNNDGFSLL